MILDDTIFYSIEYVPKDDTFNCWNQHALTHSRPAMWLLALEARLRYSPKKYRVRVREL